MSGWNRPEENTLGVILGRGARAGLPAGSPGGRAKAQAGAPGASLGSGYLGIGAGVLCAIAAVFGLAMFAVRLPVYPDVLPIVLSWLLFIAAFAGVSLTIATRGERLPGIVFGLYLFALAGVVALDFVAIWPLGDIGSHATSSVAAGFGLLLAVTLRHPRELFAAAMVLLAAFIAAVVLTTPLTAQTIPTQIITVSTAVFPALFGLFVVVRFRRMVQFELDRVLVQSTVSAPRFAVGMLASEELARLDLAAEELLDSVASGRTQLPLRPKTASTAASLATELRLHLIEGRRETWLYHAITESEQLGKSVRMSDPGSLAGLLAPDQRDGLLSAVWLLVSDKAGVSRTAELVMGPVVAPGTPGADARRSITVPIAITTTGISRNRVDPSIWAALTRVGEHVHAAERGALRIDIRCIVANPADL